MAATKTRSTPSSNGSAASGAVERAKEAGDAVSTAARKAKGPMLAAGATAAGLAGGLAIGSRMGARHSGVGALLRPRRRVLGVAVGRRPPLMRTAGALGKVAKELASATSKASTSADELRQVREQLEAGNRRSPVEVVLDGLTHRRGAHKRES